MDTEKKYGSEPQSYEVDEATSLGSPKEEGSWGIGATGEPPKSEGFFKDICNGFKRVDLSGIDTGNMTEGEIQAYLTSKAPLKRSLTGWQIQMIAIGGSIGSGLFIGSGSKLTTAGPAGILIGFGVMGIMIFTTMQAAGELAVRFPKNNGSFLIYVTRFLDPAWSLAMGWNYLLQWIVTFPLEIISCAITLSYWDTDNNGATNVNKAAWAALFYSICVIMNFFGAIGFGWGESILSIIKILAVTGFCIFGICIAAGARPHKPYGPYVGYGPDSQYIGAYYYHHPGAFADSAKGVFSVLVSAAFSFAGTELSALAAAETKNPSRALPRACRTVAIRIALFYIVSLTIVGCLVPYNDNRLGTTSDGRSSPFVIAISNSHIRALPSIFNVVICLAVLSVGNSCVYAGSRTIASLAAQGFLPRIFAYIDREGRPLVGLIVITIFGLLSFLAATPKYSEVFDWLLALSGLSSVFTWGSICLSHVRFRMAMHYQKRSLGELEFKSPLGIWGSLVGFGINAAVIGLQFWIAVWPVKESPSAVTFFENYLSVPIVLAFYIVAKLWFRDWKSWYVKLGDMDLDTGSREVDPDKLIQENIAEKERLRNQNWFVRTYNMLC